jgi:hypothetical protein
LLLNQSVRAESLHDIATVLSAWQAKHPTGPALAFRNIFANGAVSPQFLNSFLSKTPD